jgi:hypothetical protein
VNIFKWIAGGSKTQDDIFDKDKGLLAKAGGWIGNMNYTDEEQAEARQKMNDSVSEFVKATLEESTERSVTRRAVAVMWIKVQLAMVLITMTAAPFLDDAVAEYLLEITFSGVMTGGTLAILGFFFGSHMLSSHLKK